MGLLPLLEFPIDALPACVLADSQVSAEWRGGTALLSGSFNPVHDGHWQLANVAADILRLPVAFEITVLNADKGEIAEEEIKRRISQFRGRAPVWLTRAPTFLEKARVFPSAWFVVGADTAARLLAPRYYDEEAGLLEALRSFQRLQCRFLVACRAGRDGRCVRLEDLAVPREFADLFQAIPPQQYRLDVSSTQLRDRVAAPEAGCHE